MARQPASPQQLVDIYIDESSQTQNRYLVLGAVVIDTAYLPQFEASFARLRLPELPRNELKWGKVSRTKLPAYLRIVDGFWTDKWLNEAHFHGVVVDTHQRDHVRYNQGDADIGFNKELYQLANKCSRLYGNRLFHLYLDERNTSQTPDDLRLILNRGCKKRGDQRDWPFRRCHFRDSKTCVSLQLADIFIGAIAYHLNGHIHAAGASPPKCDLANSLCRLAGITDPFRDTKRAAKFTLWHRRLE